MGSFDTLEIDGNHYQTKALGCDLFRVVHVGDDVEVAYKSFTEEEYTLSPTHRYIPSPRDFSFLAIPDRWDGKLAGFGEHPSNRFNYRGESVGGTVWTPTIAENTSWTESRAYTQNLIKEMRRRRGHGC
jgi:hypothetical protein